MGNVGLIKVKIAQHINGRHLNRGKKTKKINKEFQFKINLGCQRVIYKSNIQVVQGGRIPLNSLIQVY